MTAKGVALTVLTLSAAAVLSACSGAQSPNESPASPPAEPSPHTRAPGDPILGVAGPSGENPPECVDSVVKRKPNVPTAELTITGQPGDRFTYEIRKKDGTTTDGSSGEFGPDQQEIVFTTGVPNADIDIVTISAEGRTGTPGTCVITTIN